MAAKEYWATNNRVSNQPTIREKFDKEQKFQALRNLIKQILVSFLTGPASNKSILLRYKSFWSTRIKGVCHRIKGVCHCIKANGHK